MKFERTRDLELVREILTEPRCWRRMVDDTAPARNEFYPCGRPGLEYIACRQDGRVLALFVLIDRGEAGEVHFCIRPESWGETAEQIARQFVSWVWAETVYQRLYGPVPAHNRLALRLAGKAGFRGTGVAKDAILRRGRKYDRILLVAERPTTAGMAEDNDEKPNPRVLCDRSRAAGPPKI